MGDRVRPALDRGWNAFVFDGPGQQSMLFERDVPFRHDWEAMVTPVVDVLVDRADVDAGALLAYAISQGGCWLPRALAFEHRFVAAVADSGVVDVARAWNVNLPPELRALVRAVLLTGSGRRPSAPRPPQPLSASTATSSANWAAGPAAAADRARWRMGDLPVANVSADCMDKPRHT